MISRNTLEKTLKNMLLNLLIMTLLQNMLRYHYELLMLFLTKIFIYMTNFTKKIKSKKPERSVLLKDEVKQIRGVVGKLNKKFHLMLLKLQVLLVILAKLKSMFRATVNHMLKIRINTRSSKIKKLERKLTISLIAANLLKTINLLL